MKDRWSHKLVLKNDTGFITGLHLTILRKYETHWVVRVPFQQQHVVLTVQPGWMPSVDWSGSFEWMWTAIWKIVSNVRTPKCHRDQPTFRGSRATSIFSPVLLRQQVFKVSTFGLCPQRSHSHIQLQQEWSKHLSQWLKKGILTHVSPIDLTQLPCWDHSLNIVHLCGGTCFCLAGRLATSIWHLVEELLSLSQI